MSYTQQDRMYTTLGLCFLIFSFFFLCLLMDMYGSDGPRHFFWLFAISYLMHSGEHTVDVYYIDTILLLFFRPHNRRLMDGDRRRRRSQEKNTKYKIKKRKLGCWTRCNVYNASTICFSSLLHIRPSGSVGRIESERFPANEKLGLASHFFSWLTSTDAGCCFSCNPKASFFPFFLLLLGSL